MGASRLARLLVPSGRSIEAPSGSPPLRIPRLGLLTAVVYSASGLVLAATAVGARLLDRPVAYLTRDPSAVLRDDPCSRSECSYVGFLSNLGVVVWSVGLASCVFVVAASGHDRRRSPFLYAGGLTAVLLADDLFQLHENASVILPQADLVTLAGYGAGAVALAVAFRRFWLRTDVALPVGAVALLAFSGLMDRYLPGNYMIEDSAKFLGIVTWSTYLVGTGLVCLANRGEGPPDAQPR